MRRCLFCEKDANTLEHVWPTWVLEKLRADRSFEMYGNVRGKREFRLPGPKAELKVRCVCDDCNQGWMSDLEVLNKPVIGPLMYDISFRLNDVQQIALALWATKTAMVIEATTQQHRQPFYTQAERAELRLSGVVPANTFIWLGRYLGGESITHWGDEVWSGPPRMPGSFHGFVNSLVVRRMFVQVVTFHIPPQYSNVNIKFHGKPGPWRSLLIPILPSAQSVSWPPPLTVDDTGAFTFARVHGRWYLGGSHTG